jgi:hypothetical protein
VNSFIRTAAALAEMRRLEVFNSQKTMPPPPRFFVSADSKGLRLSVSCLESTLADVSASVDSKELTSAHCSHLEPDGSTDIGNAIDGDLTQSSTQENGAGLRPALHFSG